MLKKVTIGFGGLLAVLLLLAAMFGAFNTTREYVERNLKLTSVTETQISDGMRVQVRGRVGEQITVFDLGDAVQTIVPQWDYVCADYGNRPDPYGVGRWVSREGKLIVNASEDGVCNDEKFHITVVRNNEATTYLVSLHVYLRP